jgi:hypothetical protein
MDLPSDQKENKSRVLLHLLLYRKVRLRLTHTHMYIAMHNRFIGCLPLKRINHIQGVSEIGTLILTGNRTRQKEQLFYLPFCRKTMFNSKKKLERFFTKIALRH